MYMTHRDMLYPMAQLATWHLDGVAIPVSSTSKPAELEYLLHDSQADIVICHNDFKKKFKELNSSYPVIVHTLDDKDIDLTCRSLLQKHAKIIPPKQDALIVYTSGTTGKPKGVVHTHGSLEAMMKSMERAWGWTEDDHVVNVLPLHNLHGIANVLNTSLWSGA